MKPHLFGYPLTVLANIEGKELDVSEIIKFDPASRTGVVGIDESKFLDLVDQEHLRGYTLPQRVERLERKLRAQSYTERTRPIESGRTDRT